MMLKKLLQWLQKNNYILLILIGSFCWTLVMWRNGLVEEYGMGFWGANAHDGLWHISLAEGFKRGSWTLPMFVGETIKNYHIGFDLLLAVISKITFIPVTNLYFQIIPPIFAILIGFSSYQFILRWIKSSVAAWWSVFFIYFGGSFGYFVSLYRGGSLNSESMFWSMQSISTLINPPFALSLILIFAGFYFLIVGIEEEKKSYLGIATFCFGLLSVVKVYASILLLFGLFVSSGYRFFKYFKLDMFKVFFGVTLITALILLSQTNDYGGAFIWKPFWYLETMMSGNDRLYWPRFAEAMINYKLAGNWIKGISAYAIAFGIFVIGNLGTRIIGAWCMDVGRIGKQYSTQNSKNYQYVDLMLVTIIGFGILIPTLFVQRGTTWNTIQFIYYSLFFIGIYSGIFVGKIIEKNILNKFSVYVFKTLIILFTIPSTLGTLQFYLSEKPSAVISKGELEALNFLQNQPKGVVLTQPFYYQSEEVDGYQPLYSYESTAYVSALTKQDTYFEDYINMNIMGFDWEERIEKYADVVRNKKIDYVYVLNRQHNAQILMNKESVIFENENVTIYANK